MQYKIPLQIENEDTIVAGLSLRQLTIIMIWGGLAYSIFKFAEPRFGAEVGLILSIPLLIMGIIIALLRIAEMTFLPTVLNFFRLSLNARSRTWSQGTDGFSDVDIGYVFFSNEKGKNKANQSLESRISGDGDANDHIMKL